MTNLLLAIIYLAFVSLGLPDSLLGSAWPSMYPELGVPVSFAGGVSMIIAFGTVVSSLQSDRLTRRFGTGRVTAFSVATTAVALLGFSLSRSYVELCLWAVPYGLGAGSVDASLNNYVALHYESRHMSWLHCMWGVGAAAGPYVMGWALTGGLGWPAGYRAIGVLQVALAAALMLTLPLWRGRDGSAAEAEAEAGEAPEGASGDREEDRPLSLREVVRIPGAKEVMVAFFCYSAIEQTCGLWTSSFLALGRGVPAETAAGFASLFYVGITVGRALSGFLTMRFRDAQMIRMGQAVILAGAACLLLPLGERVALAGVVLVGLGCAPVYPSIIHSTPEHFGTRRSQAMIGVQMAAAYVGTCLMPPVFGLLANHVGVWLLPAWLLAILGVMVAMHERLVRVRR